MRRWYYHNDEGARLFDDEIEPFPTEEQGWFDTPARLDPVAIGEPEPDVLDEREQSISETRAELIEELRAHAERLGIKVDKRWGIQRLEQEIERADRAEDH